MCVLCDICEKQDEYDQSEVLEDGRARFFSISRERVGKTRSWRESR